MKTTTKKEIRNKGGAFIPEGAAVTATAMNRGTIIQIQAGVTKINAKMLIAGELLEGFLTVKEVTAELKKVVESFDDTVVECMTGHRVEADGWDENGMPSVMLAGGLI